MCNFSLLAHKEWYKHSKYFYFLYVANDAKHGGLFEHSRECRRRITWRHAKRTAQTEWQKGIQLHFKRSITRGIFGKFVKKFGIQFFLYNPTCRLFELFVSYENRKQIKCHEVQITGSVLRVFLSYLSTLRDSTMNLRQSVVDAPRLLLLATPERTCAWHFGDKREPLVLTNKVRTKCRFSLAFRTHRTRELTATTLNVAERFVPYFVIRSPIEYRRSVP